MDTQTENETEETYKIADFKVIAFLIACDCVYVRTERSPNSDRRIFVHFANPRKCEKLVKEFWQGKSKVVALKYAKGYDMAKDLVFKSVD